MAKHLKILAKKNGYRRAGRGFSDKEPALIPVDKLSEEHREALINDSQLLVTEVDVEAPAKAAGKPKDADTK